MSDNVTNYNLVHGYKVFRSDWTCNPDGNSKQYACPGKFEEEGPLSLCEHGMHFCKQLIDCFSFYEFKQEYHVAEVVAYGEVLTDSIKSCTDKLEIVREVPWEEVFNLINIGKKCSGLGNTGDFNSGNWNTGKWNTGNCNTGDFNSGCKNTGKENKGSYNTGDNNLGRNNVGSSNSGYENVGNHNEGCCNVGSNNIGWWNTGDNNTGDKNVGCSNAGSKNVGYFNIGDHNVGNGNIGNYNTGCCNVSNYNTGYFNTEEPKIMLFNKPTHITLNQLKASPVNYLIEELCRMKNQVSFIQEKQMTDQEKAEHRDYEVTGGFIRVEPDRTQDWWDNLSEENKNLIKELPNFDPDVFYKCTGIKVE